MTEEEMDAMYEYYKDEESHNEAQKHAFNFTLIVNEGVYMGCSLSSVIWQVLKHRINHFLKGDGFVD